MKDAPVREDQGQVVEGLYVILRRRPAWFPAAGRLQNK